ncbi:prenyltransferase UbiA [Sphingomonas sp. DBB INV C78]|uniref:UbiA family prenyltransferase n=1 Tax=Sphingomonas sp. DBB INV C78 TaxID=3349434 RepID=UPI0036D2886D
MDTTIPLCVDLDGTLIRTDLLHEAMIQFAKHHPADLWRVPLWLAAGKARLKQELAARIDIDPTALPYREDLLDFIAAERQAGRPVALVTASPRRWAERIAAHLGLFDQVEATESINLKGRDKAALLVERHGHQGFDYVGDCAADHAVWEKSRQALCAGAATRLRRAPANAGASFPDTGNRWRGMVKAMRPHQWAKNALIFVPMFAGHRTDMDAFVASLLAFIAFSLAASATYLINDLLDLAADRAHPRKRLRPFAAGDVAVSTGIGMAGLLFALAIVTSLFLPPGFILTLVAYIVVTTAYSLRLKRAALVDIFTLAGLYTVRIVAGAVATGILLSVWLLVFSMFLFFALAVVKRCAELANLTVQPASRVAGRGYYPEDMDVLVGMGAASGFSATLVLAIYTTQPTVSKLYPAPELLLLICPFFSYWIARFLLLARRGHMDDDPIVFATKDRLSLATFAICGGIVLLASSGAVDVGFIADM